MLRQPRHLRARLDVRAARRPALARARARPAVGAGRDAGTVRPAGRRTSVRPQARRGRSGEGVRAAAVAERGAAPAQPRPAGRDHRAGRADGRRPPRTGQHAVLRLGVAQPGGADADSGAARRRRAGGARGRVPFAGHDGDRLRRRRLLRAVPEAVHVRVGRAAADCRAGRDGAAVPGGVGDLDALAVQRPRHTAGRDLVPLLVVQRLPRRRLDVRTLPDVRPPRLDFGGCRCQAFLLTGDAAATDPVCSRSPQRSVVDLVLARPPASDLVMRR